MLESWSWWSVEVILAIPHLDVHILNNIWSVHKGRFRYRFWIFFIRMLGQVEVLLVVQSRFNYWKKTLVLTNVVFHSSCFYMRLALDTEHGLLLSRIPDTKKTWSFLAETCSLEIFFDKCFTIDSFSLVFHYSLW